MYESFFGLRERPFDLTPNPRFLLMMPTHREALANLHYGLTARKGLTVLIGEAGSGKTTLVHAVRGEWDAAGHRVAHLSNPTLSRAEFFEYLAAVFGLSAEAGGSKARFLTEFLQFVTERHAKGGITGLVIDEAQALSDELLEEVRLLINNETASEKLFQVLLVGQPELSERLDQPALRQIKQRIALRCTLSTLTVTQVASYIAGRIQVAGGTAATVFTREAVMAVHAHSHGIPRVISVICDNVLVAGFAAGVRPIPSSIVEEICRDFGIQRAKAVVADDHLFETNAPAAPPSAAPASQQQATGQPAHPEAARDGGLFHSIAAGKRRFSFFRNVS